jgi:hypothetical protein
VIVPRQTGACMKTLETATNLFVGIAAHTLLIGLILVG